MPIPYVAGLGPGEIAIIIAVLVLLFGAKKLPELARGTGRALRIFKAETKGLMTDDDETPEQRETERRRDELTAGTEPRPATTDEVRAESARDTDR